MRTILLTTSLVLCVVIALAIAGCTQQPSGAATSSVPTKTATPELNVPVTVTAANNNTTALQATQAMTASGSKPTVNILLSKGVGPMPMLLADGQIDGYIAWQPFVEVAKLANIGKVIVYSGDLPPAGSWKNHPCDVISATDDIISSNPDFVTAMDALFIVSDDYVSNNTNESAAIAADWLVGKMNFTYGKTQVAPIDVLKESLPTIRFSSDPSPDWMNGSRKFIETEAELGYIGGAVKNASPEERDAMIFNFKPYESAKAMVEKGYITTPNKVEKQVSLGYLMSDHDTPLFVAIKNWQYFNDKYHIALKPVDPTASRPDVVELIVNGDNIANIRLISADAGPQLMTLAAQNGIQMAYAGIPPVISAIDKGTKIKVIQPVQNEGSGIVASASSPANDWKSFIDWAKQRSDEGKPLIIATPGKGSIQDVMLRIFLEENGFDLKEVS